MLMVYRITILELFPIFFEESLSFCASVLDDKRQTFFNCYSAVPQSILGQSRGDSLTNLILITAFSPKVTGNLVTRLGP